MGRGKPRNAASANSWAVRDESGGPDSAGSPDAALVASLPIATRSSQPVASLGRPKLSAGARGCQKEAARTAGLLGDPNLAPESATPAVAKAYVLSDSNGTGQFMTTGTMSRGHNDPALAHGPSWSGTDSGRYAGRYPLAVESHASRQVNHLLPGITSVTEHARFYTLHALVGAEVAKRGMVAAEAADLLRRCEVALTAVSLVHADNHSSFGRPHGADSIIQSVRSGTVDIASLSEAGRYSARQWGFWGTYVASEILLGLVGTSPTVSPGERLDEAAVRAGLGGILDIAAQSHVDVQVLKEMPELCVCRAGENRDGRLLQRLLLPAEVVAGSRADRRSQTLRMLLALVGLAEAKRLPGDLWPVLVFNEAVAEHAGLQAMDATAAWSGVSLRNRSVGAWRSLWAWLVDQIRGLTSIRVLGESLAEALPAEVANQTVGQFRHSLPRVMTSSGRLAPAEIDPTLDGLGEPGRLLAVLFLGAERGATLPEKERAYFEDATIETQQELTPSWLRNRISDWQDRPMSDFAVWLVGVLVDRSQRVALAKAGYSRRTGVFSIPTRVHERDGYVFRDSREGGGGVALRWNNAASILAGLGLATRNDDGIWNLTDRGVEARDTAPRRVSALTTLTTAGQA